jgi:hypothetical protein
MEHATGDRLAVGEEYTESFAGVSRRNARVVAETVEGMGIVAPPDRYRPLSLEGRKLWSALRRSRNLPGLVEEARVAGGAGCAGTALELGKDLWAMPGSVRAAAATELLELAYTGLGRETLRRVLQTHLANRALESVDILEEEEG